MTTKQMVINEIKHIPENYIEEIFDFVHYLKEKNIKKSMETAIASEASLKKDWLLPEEDEAWQDL